LLLLTAIAACSPVVAKFQDGSTGDDAAADAPTHGMVRVTVYDPAGTGVVVTGVPVVFVEADGTQVGHPVTDANGVVSADVHAGASATVVITMPSGSQMSTLLGLEPGDDIIFGPRGRDSADAGTFAVSFPTFSGAASYEVYGPCGSASTAGTSVTLGMDTVCKQDTMDLLVVAMDAGGNPIAALQKTGVTFTAGGSTAVTGTYQFVSQFTASYTDIPAAVTRVGFRREVPDDYGYSSNGTGTPSSGTFSASVPGPQGASALVSTDVINNTTGGQQTITQQIQGNALTYGMDVGTTLLPWIGQLSLDLAAHTIVIPIDNTGTSGDAPDVFFAQAGYDRGTSPSVQHFTWLVVGATPGDVTLPTLPPEVGDVMPKPTDTALDPLAALAESDALSGYDVIRQDVFTLINSVTDPVHPQAGRTRLSINFGRFD
jgi:hypothetical protein